MKATLFLTFLLSCFTFFGQKEDLINNEWIGGFCTRLKFDEDSCQVFSDGEKYEYTATDSTLFFTKRAKGCSAYYYEIRNDSLQLSSWDGYWRKLPKRGPCGRHLLFSPRLLKRKTKDFEPLSPFDSLQTYPTRSLDFALNDQREFTFKIENPSVDNQEYNLPGYYSGKLSESQWKDLIEILDSDCKDMYIGVIRQDQWGQKSLKIWYDSLRTNMTLNKAEEFIKYLHQKIPTYSFYLSDENGARDTVPRTLVDLIGHSERFYLEGKVMKGFFDQEGQKYYYSFKPSESYSDRGPLTLLHSSVPIPRDSLVGIMRIPERDENFNKTRLRGLHIYYYGVDSVYQVKNHNVILDRLPAGSHHFAIIPVSMGPQARLNKKLFADWLWRMSDLAKFLKEISKDYIRVREEND